MKTVGLSIIEFIPSQKIPEFMEKMCQNKQVKG